MPQGHGEMFEKIDLRKDTYQEIQTKEWEGGGCSVHQEGSETRDFQVPKPNKTQVKYSTIQQSASLECT